MMQWNRRGWIGVSVALSLAAGVGAFTVATRSASAQQPGVVVIGNWTTQWAGSASVLTFQQVGRNVTGTYTATRNPPGALAGVLNGNVLVGRWTDPQSSGGFAITFAADGRSFAGTWGRTVDSVNSGGPWIGQR